GHRLPAVLPRKSRRPALRPGAGGPRQHRAAGRPGHAHVAIHGERKDDIMSLVGVDINASRARAVAGPALQALNLVYLDADHIELPLPPTLEKKPPRAGRAGPPLTPPRPPPACHNFLPYLGHGHLWATEQHRLDADAALTIVFRNLAGVLRRSAGLAFCLPAY